MRGDAGDYRYSPTSFVGSKDTIAGEVEVEVEAEEGLVDGFNDGREDEDDVTRCSSSLKVINHSSINQLIKFHRINIYQYNNISF